MEELLRISKEYYRSCVDLRLFSFKGGFYVLLGIPFFVLSVFIVFTYSNSSFGVDFGVIAIQLCGMMFWKKAKDIYNENLIERLKAVTNLNSNNVESHKVAYLSSLTSEVGDSLFEALKNSKELVEVYNKSRSYTPSNIGYHFSRFVYESESKNRILSLSIYLLSLIAVLAVIKPAKEEQIYGFIEAITLSGIFSYLGGALMVLVLCYFVFMLPFSIAIGYVVSPVMRGTSNNSFLIGYLLSELCRFSFLDKKLTRSLGKDVLTHAS